MGAVANIFRGGGHRLFDAVSILKKRMGQGYLYTRFRLSGL